MTTKAELYRRAGALCITGEPHDEITNWPCALHVQEAARQLNLPAAPSASSTGAPQPAGDEALGAAGCPPSVSGSTPNSNRPVREHRAAESGPVRPQIESMA